MWNIGLLAEGRQKVSYYIDPVQTIPHKTEGKKDKIAGELLSNAYSLNLQLRMYGWSNLIYLVQ